MKVCNESSDPTWIKAEEVPFGSVFVAKDGRYHLCCDNYDASIVWAANLENGHVKNLPFGTKVRVLKDACFNPGE